MAVPSLPLRHPWPIWQLWALCKYWCLIFPLVMCVWYFPSSYLPFFPLFFFCLPLYSRPLFSPLLLVFFYFPLTFFSSLYTVPLSPLFLSSSSSILMLPHFRFLFPSLFPLPSLHLFLPSSLPPSSFVFPSPFSIFPSSSLNLFSPLPSHSLTSSCLISLQCLPLAFFYSC